MVRKSVTEAKAELSKLLTLAEQGETVIITRGGKEVAQIIPSKKPMKKRQMGLAKGKIWISPDIDEVDKEIARLMLGEV